MTRSGDTPSVPAIATALLMVDDQPKNLLALEALLEPLGVELVRANSGQEALKHLLTRDFAAILLDVQMPTMDGFETAALIKDRERSRHIPIIFLTAISKDEAFVFRGYTVGAVDYMAKPFDPDILRSKVQVFIDLYRKTELLKIHEKALRERELAELRKVSERRYKDLAESMPQIVWMADANGRLTYGNRRWFDCVAASAKATADINALRWDDILLPEDLDRFLEQMNTAREAGTSWSGEYRFGSSTTNVYRWHLVRVVPLVQDDDQVTSWVGTSTDIDDRRHAEDALRLLAEASTILGSSLDYKKTFDEVARLTLESQCDWCVVDAARNNGSVERLVVASCAASPDGGETARSVANVIATNTAQLVSDPTADWTSWLCAPIVLRDRTFGALSMACTTNQHRFSTADLEIAQDLARRMAAAIEISELYDIAQNERVKLEAAHKAKDEFLATLSHELRTPLNAMLGWTQLLRAGDLEESEFDRALETIERNAKAQAQLIADLLDVSRIVTGKLHLNVGKVQLPSLIEAAIDAVRLTADAKKITLETSLDPFTRDVKGDPNRLLQVLGNLLNNALKFTPANGTVRIELHEDAERARVTVSDTGQGISAEFLPYVFDRFRQADSTSTRTQGGLGLGLAIVSHLVQLHGGTVEVSSPGKDKGSTFTVELPIPLEQPESTDARLTPAPQSRPANRARELLNLHILLVEDHPDGRGMARAVLERAGALVTEVSSASAALEAIQLNPADPPDILVSDIGLPDEDGYALIKKVRALMPGHGGDILAVALTAYASEEDRLRALRAGFDAHLTKPIEPSQLTMIVSQLARDGAERISSN
ncbi:MAG: phoR4 [Myxococcaceae bacterium]|nr:phoR4 [Myxococcaceae bacterium]